MALSNMTARAATPDDLQRQLDQLQRNYLIGQNNNPIHTSGQLGASNDAYANFQRQQIDLANRINAARGGTGGAGDPMQQSLQQIRNLTEGRAGELASDPYQRSVMDFLQGVTNGQNVPFTNEVQSAMLAQQGKGFSDAEAASMDALRQGLAASGGSIYDPGYQAAQREAMSRRQGQNLDAAGRMASQAGLANFDARMGGAGQLAAARNAQNAQINQMNLAGAGYRARETREEATPQTYTTYQAPRPQVAQAQQVYRPPLYQPQQPQQPQPTQAAPTQQTAATRPAAAPTQPAAPRPINLWNPTTWLPQNYQVAPGVIRPSGTERSGYAQ